MASNSRSMLLDILRYPDERLMRMSEPVGKITDEIRKFCADLSETMVTRDGVGIAAPQVGVPMRIFILNDGKPRVFINPTIQPVSQELVESTEGCLSFPGIFIKVERFSEVYVTATDLDGNTFEVGLSGLMSRAAQHEYDHLNGKLLSDFMSHLKKQMVLKKIKKLERW